MGSGKYDSIIDLPHYQSSRRPHMSNYDRAAQFSPFAALTGYSDAIRETGRLTEERVELDEDMKEGLDEKLRMLKYQIEEGDYPEAAITYFQPDNRKEGGSYVTVSGRVKKIDGYGQALVMVDGMRVLIKDIAGLSDLGIDRKIY